MQNPNDLESSIDGNELKAIIASIGRPLTRRSSGAGSIFVVVLCSLILAFNREESSGTESLLRYRLWASRIMDV